MVLKALVNRNVFEMYFKGCRCGMGTNVLWKAVRGRQ